MVIWILPTAISLLRCPVGGRPPGAAVWGRDRLTAWGSPLGLPPAGLALLVGEVGIVRGGQLGPAGVIAQQVAQVRTGLIDQPLPLDLLQVDLAGLPGVYPQGGADLRPAVALLAGLAHRPPAPADQLLDHLPVGRQRRQRPRPLGPLRMLVKDGKRLTPHSHPRAGGPHHLGIRPGLPGLPRDGERVPGLARAHAATSPSSPVGCSGWTGARSSTCMAGWGTAASTAMAKVTRRRERNQGRSRIRTGGRCPYTSRARRGLSCRNASGGNNRRYAVDSVSDARPSPPVVSEVWTTASSPTSLEASSRDAGSACPDSSSLARCPFSTVEARWP